MEIKRGDCRGDCGALTLLVAILLAAFTLDGLDAQNTGSTAAQPVDRGAAPSLRGPYAGDEACASCHREKVDSFHQTAHFLTSRAPEQSSIHGSFATGSNAFATSNPDLSFRMDAKANGFFQTAIEGIAPYTTEHAERIAIVVGSGGKGQTYLYWKKDQLFQLPVSYWTELGWVNSPGYRDGVANFNRPVMPRCLECHATYFETNPPPFNRYRPEGFALGITCEKCHGAGGAHQRVENAKAAHDSSIPVDPGVINPGKFARDRQIDLCAWCHAGAGTAINPPFSYRPGEVLSKYLQLPPTEPGTQIDVHGSQVELLEKSRCFQRSQMTCFTCHDVHRQQHDLVDFNRRCLGCHEPATAMFPKANHAAGSDCVSCHMPRQETNLIVFDWQGKKVRPQVRTHWIKTYAAASQPSN